MEQLAAVGPDLAVGLGILAVHLAVLVGAGLLWGRRARSGGVLALLLDGLGLLAAPVAAALSLVLLDPSTHAGQGSHAAWYLIFSVVSLGVVPAVTLLSFLLTGRLLGRLYRWRVG